jgi:uncharacterized protein
MTNIIGAGIAAVVRSLGLAARLAAGPFEDGLAAYRGGDYATAIRLWRPLADQGNAAAQFYLGFMYANGQGVSQDDAAAVSWYQKAADQGNAAAQSYLGFMYQNGRGVPQDDAAGVSWYQKAADQGIGFMSQNGRGVPKVLGRWATVGFAILASVPTAVIAGVIGVVAMRIMMPAKKPVRFDGTTLAIVSLIFNPLLVVALMLSSRRSGFNVLAYLGLDIPRWRHIAITVAGLAVWIVFGDALQLALGWNLVTPWQLAIYRSARAEGSLIWLWLAIAVAAPIGEELLFRGFIFRGFVHTQRDALPSIALISLIWSLLHIQYDLLGITMVFVFGVLLGLVRWSTGSTTLTILLHILNNLEGWIETELVLG